MTSLHRIILISSLLLLPTAAFCQNKKEVKDGKKVINVNKLDVIYHDQDSEYPDIVTEPQTPETRRNTPPTLSQPEPEDDEELEQASQLYRPEQMGEGVESEFDILYASMDYEVIHYASNNEIPNGVPSTSPRPPKDANSASPPQSTRASPLISALAAAAGIMA